MSWAASVPKVVDGTTPLNAAGLNPATVALEERTNYLKQLLDASGRGNGTVVTDIGFQSCTRGQLVAYSRTLNAYTPAKPSWNVSDADGSLYPSEEAYVCGVLISDPSADSRGLLMLSGVISDSTLVNTLTGAGGTGEYYLSGNGVIARGIPTGVLPVYCGYKTSSGLFILRPAAPDCQGHTHTNYALNSSNWFSVSGGVPSGYTAPDGALYGYDLTNDPTAAVIFSAAPPSALTIVNGGRVLSSSTYTLSGGTLWLLFTPTSPIDVSVCSVNPFLGASPEVSSIAPASGNNIIKATKVSGTVYLDTDFSVTNNANYTGTCITSLLRGGVGTAPSVHQLKQGAGASITAYAENGSVVPGVYVIGTTAATSTLIDFQTINANNVLLGGANSEVLITFPAQINSSLLGIARVPATDSTWNIKVFLWLRGTSASSTALSGTLKVQSASASGVAVATAQNITFSPVSGAVANNLYQVECNETVSAVAGNALISVELAATAPATSIELAASGISLQ